MTENALQAKVQGMIIEVCDELKALLLFKNDAYGNSAIEPKRIFSKADPVEQIRVRIDDKLSRIATGAPNAPQEDTKMDLMGYLVLERVAERLKGAYVEQ